MIDKKDPLFSPDGWHLIDPGGDFFRTLENCQGWYDCPVDPDGKPLGPIVGYTADHPKKDGTKWVGLHYANFAKADPWPAVLEFFALEMVRRLKVGGLVPDLVVGAPWAGVKFSQEVARLLGCRHIFAEKKGDDIVPGRYEGEINPGETVAVGEELVNNLSTAGKMFQIVQDQGARVNSIICAINRSSPFKWGYTHSPEQGSIPLLGVIEREMPQYHRDDPRVASAIQQFGLVDKPKYAWPKLYAAMEAHR